jgi:ketosteroid isomerase-like protein
MGLRPLLIGATVILFGGQARADTAEEVERSVRTIQTAFNKGEVNTLKGLMTEDHVTILTYARFSNAADQLKVLAEFKFTEYKMTGLKVKALTKDVALASYQASIKGTYKAKEVPSPVQVIQVWINRDGKWLQASYQETPVDRK